MRAPHSPHIPTVLAICLLLCFLLLSPCATADAPKTLSRSLPRSLHRPQQNNGGDNAADSAFNNINYRRLMTRDVPSPASARDLLSPASARSALPMDRCQNAPMGDPICDPTNYSQTREKQQLQPQRPSSTTSTSNAIVPVIEPRRLGGGASSDVGRKMLRRRTWTKRGSGEALVDNQEVSKRYVSRSGGVGSHFQKDDVQGR